LHVDPAGLARDGFRRIQDRNATFGLQGNLGQKGGNLQYGALFTAIPLNR
jgi:hypothetical protein